MAFCAPQIVASIALTGQTAAISNSTIFTLTQPGIFRISGVLYITIASGAFYEVDAAVTATSQPTLTFGQNQGLGAATPVASMVTWGGISSTAVVLNTTLSGSGTLDHYDLYVTIEQVA